MGSTDAAQQQTEGEHGEQQQQGQQHRTVQQPEFLAIVQNKIAELETTMGSSGNHAEKESAKNRKRALKEVERFLENRAHTPEDKVNFLQTKCTQMITDLHRVEKSFHEAQGKLDVTTREKDKVQFELKKTNAVRDKLEELCRQLQRDNREVLDTARKLREEDAAQRQALQVKFSGTINEVNARVEEQHADRERQQKVNEDLQAKLLEVMGSMDSYNKLLHSKDLEVQLANAKLKQQEAINEQLMKKNELYLQSHEQLEKTHQSISSELEVMLMTKQQNTMLQEANATLKAQIEENGKQFSSIQSAINKSNKVFDQYKKDADIASKQRAQLLLDCEAWKSKCIASAQQVEQLQKKLELASVDPDEVKRLRTQKEALEGLCRSLQAQVKCKSGKQETQEGGELRPPPQSPQSNEV